MGWREGVRKQMNRAKSKRVATAINVRIIKSNEQFRLEELSKLKDGCY